jgi:hypothetical protein
MNLDSGRIAANTCPLCGKRALSWNELLCTCGSCGSIFEINPETKRCHYLYVAHDEGNLVLELSTKWLTRSEVFGLVRSIPREQNATIAPIASPTTAPNSVKVVWGVLIGALALIPILCACLAAIMLSSVAKNTRTIIEAANQTVYVASSQTMLTKTVEMQPTVNNLNPLNSPLATPQQEAVSTSDATIATVQLSETAFPTSLVDATVQATGIVLVTNEFGAVPATLAPSRTPVLQSTATLPATFTPVVAVTPTTKTPTPTASPTPSRTPTVTVTPTTQTIITTTATPAPSVTPALSGSVIIVNVMYTGTASLNQSDQYVEVLNRSQTQVNVGNWILHAQSSGRVFLFPSGLLLAPGQACRIYGNSPPANAPCGPLSFNSPTPVWNEVGDIAELRDAGYVLMSMYTYTGH